MSKSEPKDILREGVYIVKAGETRPKVVTAKPSEKTSTPDKRDKEVAALLLRSRNA